MYLYNFLVGRTINTGKNTIRPIPSILRSQIIATPCFLFTMMELVIVELHNFQILLLMAAKFPDNPKIMLYFEIDHAYCRLWSKGD